MTDDLKYEGELIWLLRVWWLFPLCGFALSWLASSYGWRLLLLDDSIRPATSGWRSVWTHVPAAIGSLLLPAAWILAIKLERRDIHQVLRRACAAPLLSVLAVCGADMLLRHPISQGALWLSVRARSLPGTQDFFVTELSYLRLDEIRARADVHPGSWVVVGSSAVLRAIDFEMLQKTSPGVPVLRRALAGMTPLLACGAVSRFSTHPGDTLVLMIAEGDFLGSGGLRADWYRPVITMEGFRTVLPLLEPRDYWDSRSALADMFVASMAETWRIRDEARRVVFNLGGLTKEVEKLNLAEVVAEQKKTFDKGLETGSLNPRQIAAFEKLVQWAHGKSLDVIVFEGRANPLLYAQNAIAMRSEVRALMHQWSAEWGFRYIDESSQGVALGPEDWHDAFHLNDTGRRKFTEYLSQFIVARRGESSL